MSNKVDGRTYFGSSEHQLSERINFELTKQALHKLKKGSYEFLLFDPTSDFTNDYYEKDGCIISDMESGALGPHWKWPDGFMDGSWTRISPTSHQYLEIYLHYLKDLIALSEEIGVPLIIMKRRTCVNKITGEGVTGLGDPESSEINWWVDLLWKKIDGLMAKLNVLDLNGRFSITSFDAPYGEAKFHPIEEFYDYAAYKLMGLMRFSDDLISEVTFNIYRERASRRLAIHSERDGLVQERDGLIHEREGLIHERDGLIHERDGLVHERDGLIHERNGLIYERDGLVHERDGLVHERNGLTHERDGLIHERNGLIYERDGLVHERNGLTHERDGLIHERNGLIHERDGLIHERNALIHERDGLIHERNALIHERDGLIQERHSLVHDRDALHSSLNNLVTERESISAREIENARIASECHRQELATISEARDNALAENAATILALEELQKSYIDLSRRHDELSSQRDRLFNELRLDEGPMALRDVLPLARAWRPVIKGIGKTKRFWRRLIAV
ncbi:GAGA binding -like family protein [Burkholderia cepacia]|nr:GAGA binding -like family protein [Burkholderia cepacia]